MRFVRTVPLYAIAVLLAMAVVAVADARHWSGWTTILVGAAAGVVYTVTVAVPWLLQLEWPTAPRRETTRQELARASHAEGENRSIVGTSRVPAPGLAFIESHGENFPTPVPQHVLPTRPF